MINVKIKKLRENAQIPAYATEGSAAVDLRYAGDETLKIVPGERKLTLLHIYATKLPRTMPTRTKKRLYALLCAITLSPSSRSRPRRARFRQARPPR